VHNHQSTVSILDKFLEKAGSKLQVPSAKSPIGDDVTIWVIVMLPFVAYRSALQERDLPARVMFLRKADQVVDLQWAAIVQDHMPVVPPKHLVDLAKDDPQIGARCALLERGKG
jgi:hypothetical protein